MRNILAFLAAVVLTVGIAGWYLGWYQVHSSPASTGHRNVSIDFNTTKIGKDLKTGADELSRLGEKIGHDAGSSTKKDKTAPESVTPNKLSE